jgi:hypothetical protein
MPNPEHPYTDDELQTMLYAAAKPPIIMLFTSGMGVGLSPQQVGTTMHQLIEETMKEAASETPARGPSSRTQR